MKAKEGRRIGVGAEQVQLGRVCKVSYTHLPSCSKEGFVFSIFLCELLVSHVSCSPFCAQKHITRRHTESNVFHLWLHPAICLSIHCLWMQGGSNQKQWVASKGTVWIYMTICIFAKTLIIRTYLSFSGKGSCTFILMRVYSWGPTPSPLDRS